MYFSFVMVNDHWVCRFTTHCTSCLPRHFYVNHLTGFPGHQVCDFFFFCLFFFPQSWADLFVVLAEKVQYRASYFLLSFSLFHWFILFSPLHFFQPTHTYLENITYWVDCPELFCLSEVYACKLRCKLRNICPYAFVHRPASRDGYSSGVSQWVRLTRLSMFWPISVHTHKVHELITPLHTWA